MPWSLQKTLMRGPVYAVPLVAAVIASATLASPPAVAAPSKVRIPADCRDHAGGGDLVARACLEEATLRIELGSRAGGVRAQLQRTINPEGTFADEVVITAFDAKSVALSYDDTECTVSLLVDRETSTVRADSGCTNSRYCEILGLPAASAKEVAVACEDGSGKTAREMLPLLERRTPPPPSGKPRSTPKAKAAASMKAATAPSPSEPTTPAGQAPPADRPAP